ncbi:MAG: hypothetical protein ACPIOQ_34705, partial [Promethearchaeia archaeon]
MSGTRIPCPPLTRRGGDLSGEGSGDGDNLSGGGPKEERKDASVIILSRGNVPLLSGALRAQPGLARLALLPAERVLSYSCWVLLLYP